jgi:hypothetical protein
MYRIELSPGEETVFRSIEELAVAIKRGVVTPRARIFHNASSKWLPIQFHPHYKTALSLPLTQAALVAGPQAKPLSSLSLELPPEPEPEPEMRFPLPQPQIVSSPKPTAEKKKPKSKQLTGETRSRRRSKPRQQLRIALVGALLLGGAQWVLSVPLIARAKPTLLVDVQRRLSEVPASEMGQVASPNSADMVPTLPASVSAATPEVLRPAPEPRHRATAPSFGGTAATPSASPEIEPAPLTDLPVSALPVTDSLNAKLTDSTGQKAMQGILTTVSGGGSSGVKPPLKR